MARLLRVRFDAIGHRDARLDGLTIDLRGPEGAGADSVIWLRNGGGKSSILNLLFSTFLPDKRKFLGARADAKARALEDYVKADDLAVILTEWALGAPSAQRELALGPGRTLTTGQVLWWKGGQRSGDASKLERLFFTIRSAPEIGFDDIPLGPWPSEPVQSPDQLRDWLDDVQRTHGVEVVRIQGNQRRWMEHLELVGLDPKLFDYQSDMNLREGGADQLFRFSSPEDFVGFLLDLALDPERANLVGQNLSGLREKLERRPARELELRFLRAVLAHLEPLVVAVEAQRTADGRHGQALRHAASVCRALRRDVERLDTRLRAAEADGKRTDDEQRQTDNAVRTANRLAKGLEQRGRELALDEAMARLTHFERQRTEVRARLAQLCAARCLVKLEGETQRRVELQASLDAAEADLAPLRRALAEAAAGYLWCLDQEIARVSDFVDTQDEEATEYAAEADAQRTIGDARTGEIGGLESKQSALLEQIKVRDQHRDILLQKGLLEPRETGALAVERWAALSGNATSRMQEADAARQALEAERNATQRRREDALRADADARHHAEQLGREVDAGRRWRKQLVENSTLAEMQELDKANPDAPRLVDLLRDHARAMRRRVLELTVDGADDERALEALDRTGLLPPPRDVQRVVEALGEAGVPAHAATAWLAENARPKAALAAVCGDPARFDGVIVMDPAHLDVARGLAPRTARPVQVSVAGHATGDSRTLDAAIVIAPAERGRFDHTAADDAQPRVVGQVKRNRQRTDEAQTRERQAEKLVQEIERYVVAHGPVRPGGPTRLDERIAAAESAAEACAQSARRLTELDALRDAQAERLAALSQEFEQARRARDEANRAGDRVASYVEHQDRHVEGWRIQLEQTRKRLRTSKDERDDAWRDEAAMRALASEAKRKADEARRRHRSLRDHREAIEGEPDQAHAEGLTLDVTRARWETRAQTLKEQRKDRELRGQILELDRVLDELRRRWLDALGDLDEGQVRLIAAAGDSVLVEQEAAASARVEEVGDALGGARAAVKVAKEALGDSGRRDADDLPPDEPPPTSSTEAWEAAKRWREQAERLNIMLADIRTRRTSINKTIGEVDHRRTKRQHQRDRLEEAFDNPDAINDADLLTLAEGDAAISAQVDGAVEQIKMMVRALDEARRHTRSRAEAVRNVAVSQAFEEHRTALKTRLQADTDVLSEAAEVFAEQIGARTAVLERELAELDEHRDLLVTELDGVAVQGWRLLEQAERASRLPDGMGAWSGKSFLRVGMPGMPATDERHALLRLLVDDLVQSAQLPGGAALARRAVIRLVPRGFRVTVLKPDVVLRPDRVSVTDLGTFSGGQRLTVAVLLYCTLAHLRARQRARSLDAGILVLDNPIGSCSNVALLELQRDVARRMDVQLIYTTGVIDLEALSTLPNIVRLANTHRDRRTSDGHVTLEGSPPVSAVRVGRVD